MKERTKKIPFTLGERHHTAIPLIHTAFLDSLFLCALTTDIAARVKKFIEIFFYQI